MATTKKRNTYVKRESFGQRTRRRERAVQRAAARALRSDIKQLHWLDKYDHAAHRERARLARRIVENAKAANASPPPPEPSEENRP